MSTSDSQAMVIDQGSGAPPPCGHTRGATHPEDFAIEALVEQICAIDGCTREVAVVQVLAFEKAFGAL